ncbi:hypothetical protein CARUB_v10019487mg [Capsella rubella]|uniref:FBD domain-containing protein n=2 Tax=Capsella rubella TaxID=81985 RepID=R0HLH1_9BRAS|nr:hypothetical protein CARUB_v10019487mg [Capsella rubella]
MLPKLEFHSYDHKSGPGAFSKNVSKALLSHKAPVLQSLHLKIYLLGWCTTSDTETLIGVVLARKLRKLVLQVLWEPIRISNGLYNCETLETLELKYHVLLDVPSSVCLKSLTTLHLHYVNFKDNDSLLNLLSGCPNLENLDVRQNSVSSTKPFTIAVPSLQRLTIYASGRVDTDAGYVINAPCLKFLKIEGTDQVFGYFLIENVPELEEAMISVSSHLVNDNLLGSLTSVKRLNLESSPSQIKFPTGSIFYQLVYLELLTHNEECWNLLTLMLDGSPNLQVLKIFSHRYWNNDAVGKWNQPENVPECLLFHLETFFWKGYDWRQEALFEVVRYILSNTNCLKIATFSSKQLRSEERVEMVKDLNSVARASNSCQLLVE